MTALAMAPNGVKTPMLSNIIDEWLGNDFITGNKVKLPATNVREYDDHYLLELSVPGYQKEDFNIQLSKSLLTISTSKSEENTENKEEYRLREFSTYNFTRSFKLSDSIDFEKITATCKHGILALHLPKRDEAMPKPPLTIKIK